jgi:hypothetical protein
MNPTQKHQWVMRFRREAYTAEAWRGLSVILLGFQLAGLLLIGGCTTTEGLPSRSSSPNPAKAYVYGCFQRAQEERLNAYTLAIEVSNVETRSKKRISLRKAVSESVYAVEIPPGKYRVTGGLMIAALAPPDVLPFVGHSELTKVEFTVEAGSAYYIGDFFGAFLGATYDSTGKSLTHRDYWKIELVADNFEQTTAKLLSAYPSFAKMKRSSALATISK